MRLLTTLHDHTQAFQLSQFLEKSTVENIVDIETNSDWGDDHYGEASYRIWVFEEDHFDKATKLYQEFMQNPPPSPPTLMSPQKSSGDTLPPPKKTIYLQPDSPQKRSDFPLGQIVRLLIFLCVSLFFIQTLEFAELTSPTVPYEESFPYTTPLYQELLFDYPEKYQLAAKWITLQAKTEIDTKKQSEIYQQFLHTKAWPGFYTLFVERAQKGTPLSFSSYPLFEKISQGEIWRLITPIFLHGNLIHLLFNLFWVVILGRQIEAIIGREKFLLLVLSSAIFANIAQYLVSGPDFIGISAVVSSFVFFIGERMRRAPWEPYTLEKQTYYFLLCYIFGLAGLQFLFFLASLAGYHAPSLGIANTAHIAGGLVGLGLGATSWCKGKIS